MSRIEFIGVSKIYADGTPAVQDLDLAVDDNEFLCLLGPSGCGKSSTVRMLAGLESVSRGAIHLDGRRINEIPPQRRNAAMVFENYALYPHLNVFNNLAMPLRALGLRRREIDEKVRAAADLLRITDLLRKRPGQLSGGEKQRVGIGRAIVRHPAMFLMDEPLGHLEAYLRVEFRAEIRRLHEQLEVTTIYVTHDQEEAAATADRIAIMREGRLQQVGTIEDLMDRPCNRFVGEFIGEIPMNFLRSRVTESNGRAAFQIGASQFAPDARIQRAIGRIRDRELTLGIRAEDVQLTHGLDAGGLPARIAVVEPQGDRTVVIVDSEADRLTCVVPSDEMPAPGEHVRVLFDMSRAHLFDAGGTNVLETGPV